MNINTEQIADTLTDAIAGLAFEIGRRVRAEVEERAMWVPSSKMWEREVERIARNGVLVDYFLGQFKPVSYVIPDDQSSITCTRCGSTSYNLSDVQHRYCGQYKRFHEDPAGCGKV